MPATQQPSSHEHKTVIDRFTDAVANVDPEGSAALYIRDLKKGIVHGVPAGAADAYIGNLICRFAEHYVERVYPDMDQFIYKLSNENENSQKANDPKVEVLLETADKAVHLVKQNPPNRREALWAGVALAASGLGIVANEAIRSQSPYEKKLDRYDDIRKVLEDPDSKLSEQERKTFETVQANIKKELPYRAPNVRYPVWTGGDNEVSLLERYWGDGLIAFAGITAAVTLYMNHEEQREKVSEALNKNDFYHIVGAFNHFMAQERQLVQHKHARG